MNSRSIIFTISILFVFCFLLTACAGRGGGLDGIAWELVELDGSQPLTGTTITLTFEDGSAGGSSGCNSYGGEYQLNGEDITFGDLASTLMACLDEGVMAQESAFLAFLQGTRTYAIKDGFLNLYREDGTALKFKRQ